ncbi:MAG: DUF1326 domain-containing protein [Chthoniobacterales bacterium]
MKKWFFEADYLQSCNCDYGCPCEFSAPPSTGFCEGLCIWRIDKGEHDGLALDGLGLGLAVKWPGAIHQGNGTALAFVDEKATAEQRDALLQIASGQAGGLPFEILSTTLTTVLEPRFVPFDFHFDGLNSSVRVGDELRLALEPIRNPVTNEPEQVTVNHGTGFIFQTAECASAKEGAIEAKGMQFSYPNKAGFIARIHYHN